MVEKMAGKSPFLDGKRQVEVGLEVGIAIPKNLGFFRVTKIGKSIEKSESSLGS